MKGFGSEFHEVDDHNEVLQPRHSEQPIGYPVRNLPRPEKDDPAYWSTFSSDNPVKRSESGSSSDTRTGVSSDNDSTKPLPDAGGDHHLYAKPASEIGGPPKVDLGQVHLRDNLFERGDIPDPPAVERYFVENSSISDGIDELSVILESRRLSSLDEAVREFKPRSIALVDDVLSFVSSLRDARPHDVSDLYEGKLAFETLMKSLPDIGAILGVSDDLDELHEWGLTTDTLEAAASGNGPGLNEATTALNGLRQRLIAVPVNVEGGETLVGLLPAVTRVGSAAAIGIHPGAAYSETVKGLITAIITTAATEGTNHGIELWQRRGKFNRARDSYVRLRAAVLRLERETDVAGDQKHQALTRNALHLSLYAARQTSHRIR